MKNYKSISAQLLAVLAISLIGACGGGSSPAVLRPETVKPTKPAEPKKEAEPLKTPAQPEVKVEDVKVEQPAQHSGDAQADKSDAQSEQKAGDASQEPIAQTTPAPEFMVPPMGVPTPTPFGQPEVVTIVNNSKPVIVDAKRTVEPVVEDTKVEDIKVETETEAPEAEAPEAKFKLVDRSVGYSFVTSGKSKLGLDEIELQDDEFYVRCETAGRKPVHMLATVEYMKGLQARDNLRPTATGFRWTQDSLDFDCEVYRK